MRDREGLIEVAHAGTLFLDEISEMGAEAQARMLKVLEEKTFRRLGETKVRRSDFRLICATNADLAERVEQGGFRRDLYYRLQIFPIMIPPLRARRVSLPFVLRRALQSAGYRHADEPLPTDVEALLLGYAWPGNVRELQNVVERAVLLARGGRLTTACFPGVDLRLNGGVGEREAAYGGDEPAGCSPLEEAEAEKIREVMRSVGFDIERAVRLLGLSRASLYRRLKKYGIRRDGGH